MKFVIDMLKGAVMGLANVIPGVSGGTMAVAMGIYDKLIGAITHLFKEFKKSFITVLPIGLGMLIGIVGLSVIVEWMFGTIPVQTNLLFIGLIIGGVPAIYKRVKSAKVNAGHIIGFIIFFGIVVGLSFLQRDTEIEKAQMENEKVVEDSEDSYVSDEVMEYELNTGSVLILFGMGVIASATMVIPGVSGSMMLMLLGYYTLIIGTVSGAIKALMAGQMTELIHCGLIMIPFAVGVVVGIFGIAKIIEILLSKCEVITFWCIMGLIIGSPFAIAVVNLDLVSKLNAISITTGIVALAVGCVIAYFLGGEKEA